MYDMPVMPVTKNYSPCSGVGNACKEQYMMVWL